MSSDAHDNYFLKPKRKTRPVTKKVTKILTDKDSVANINSHSRFLSQVDTNSQLEKEPQVSNTMITRNRITTQSGIFNMAKVSKTVSRGPLSNHVDTSMMDQDPQNCESTMVSRVINQSQLLDHTIVGQEHSLMDISRPVSPDHHKMPIKRGSKLAPLHNQYNYPTDCKLGQPDITLSEEESNTIPFKEIEHNLIHGINSEDYLKRSNTLSLIKRDLHATIKRNIPHEIYLQFFKKSNPTLPHSSTFCEKKTMPLQPSHLANIPKSQQESKLSEWTMLMGTFSSQEDEDNSLAYKPESKLNVTSMMDTDISISQPMVGYESGSSKPDYLDSPSPVTMYPHKMF